MKTQTFIESLNELFGRDRSFLRKALLEMCNDLRPFERLGRRLKKETGQPVGVWSALTSETLDNLDNPKFDLFDTGDPAYEYQIVLNPGIKRGYDYDEKLIRHCGGTALICHIWVSILLPYYAIDIYSMKHDPQQNLWEFNPYTPKRRSEKKVVEIVREVLKSMGYRKISKVMAKQIVPKAITDVCEKGSATVFSCLFSDIKEYQGATVRFLNNPFSADYPDLDLGWREVIDRRGRLLKRSHYFYLPTGECVVVDLDKNYRATKISGRFKNWKKGLEEKSMVIAPERTKKLGRRK